MVDPDENCYRLPLKFICGGTASADAVVRLLNFSNLYAAHLVENEIGIRITEKGNLFSFPQLECSLTSSDQSALRLSAAIEKYKCSKRGRMLRDEYQFHISWDDIIARFQDLPRENPTVRDWGDLSKCITLSPFHRLSDILMDFVVPKIFEWHPSAIVHVYLAKDLAVERLGLSRLLRQVGSLPPPKDLNSLPQSLADWRLIDDVDVFEHALKAACLVAKPQILAYHLGPPGLLLQVVGSPLDISKGQPFPSSEYDFIFQGTGFGQPESGFKIHNDGIDVHETHVLGTIPWHHPIDDAADFCKCIANAIGTLYDRLMRIEHYLDALERYGPSLPYEYLLTLDRIVLRTLRLQASSASTIDYTDAFEIADLISKLRSIWSGQRDTKEFGWIFSQEGSCVIADCLSQLPSSWGEPLASRYRTLWMQINHHFLGSVWDPKRVTSKHVDISAAGDSSSIESHGDFVKNIIRDIRNTHHGYIADRSESKLRLLLSTGGMPPQFSPLPLLWMLAIFSRPDLMIGGPR